MLLGSIRDPDTAQYSLLYSVAKRNNFEFVLPKENLKNIVDSGFNPVINKKESMYLYLPECFNITGKFLPKSEIHSKYFYDHGRDYAKYSPEVFNISDNTKVSAFTHLELFQKMILKKNLLLKKK